MSDKSDKSIISEKNKSNRFNLKNGLAFAYRMGDLVENSLGNAISSTHLEAPALEGDELQPGMWYRRLIEGGISGDGSEYHIYLKKGTSEHLCIFLSGGGVAWNEYTAARPVTGGKMTAGLPNYYWNNLRPFTQIMNIHIGITDIANPLNPFRDWNFIIITYATGDFHVGCNDFPYRAEDGSDQVVHFRGHSNFTGAMKEAKTFFPHPDKLLIAGDSAGAFAVPVLTDEIIEKNYPECDDVTLLSDSGQLLYPHWRHTAREIWKADASVWKPIHTSNITMDWYRRLYSKYGDRLRYLYASSTHDYLLSAYYNDIVNKKYMTDSDVQEAFYHQLQDMVKEFSDMAPESGFFINEFKNLTVYPGLRGGTIHTAVRQIAFWTKTWEGISMAQWLADAVNGKVFSVGRHLL